MKNMNKKELGRANLIDFLPVKEKESVLHVKPGQKPWEQGGTYDWIFVFPYEEKKQGSLVIKKLLGMLTKTGHLYLAAENPFSIHRLSGEAEEDGSVLQAFQERGFEKSKGLSLSLLKRQAEEALKECDSMYSMKLYYPYPDIFSPSALYTDGYLPKPGDCDENYYNFQHARFAFFDERQAVPEVVQAGMYPQLANGYLVELAAEPVDILYCRYSVERALDKRIYTSISRTLSGKLAVKKTAYTPEANEHIKKLCQWEKKLAKQLEHAVFLQKRVCVNRLTAKEQINQKEQVTFAYVEGESLENYLDRLLRNGEFLQVKQVLLEFCRMLGKLEGQQPFQMTREFEMVFGVREEDGLFSMPALSLMDIDMVCQNVLLGETVTLIDYEWTFAFPIPVSYLIYRVLFLYLEQKERRKLPGFDNEFDFYGEMGINKEQRRLFEKMETGFQKYAQGGCMLLRDAYLKEGKPVVPMSVLKKQLPSAEKGTVCIQYDTGQGFSRKEAIKKELHMEETGAFSMVLDLPKQEPIRAVKLSFGQAGSILRIGLLQENETGSSKVLYETNGVPVNPILYVYEQEPYLVTKNLCIDVKRLYFSFELVELPGSFTEETIKALSDMREIIANREEQMAAYENSASWKLTKPLRRLGRLKRNK